MFTMDIDKYIFNVNDNNNNNNNLLAILWHNQKALSALTALGHQHDKHLACNKFPSNQSPNFPVLCTTS